MTTATFEQAKNKYNITIEGHAGFNSNGADIVCSACSILAYTLMECILSLKDKGNTYDIKSEIDEKAGYFSAMITTKHDECNELNTTVHTIATGYALLQNSYPDHVKLNLKSGEK